MIEVAHLNKTFTRSVKRGRRVKKETFYAVEDISFQVNKGEIYGILGPNGAGKTTLLRMLAGILTPTSGTVKVAGIDYNKDRNSAKQLIGYLSGNTKLYGRLSPREVLEIFGGLYAMEEGEIKKRVEEIIKLLRMEGFVDNRIERLSTGQMQRASIARCLIHSPQLYIFDEPTLGLDVLSSQIIIDFMKEEKKRGKTVIYSTHYMEEAQALCDKILMIHEGKVVACNTSEALKEKTRTDNLRDAFISLVGEEIKSHEV